MCQGGGSDLVLRCFPANAGCVSAVLYYDDTRWIFYKDAVSFASLHQSFASMTDIIMLSNWPIFMDAAGDVGSLFVARLFFYSFKVRRKTIVMVLFV